LNDHTFTVMAFALSWLAASAMPSLIAWLP